MLLWCSEHYACWRIFDRGVPSVYVTTAGGATGRAWSLLVFRGDIVNRNYGTDTHIPPFLLLITTFGPLY